MRCTSFSCHQLNLKVYVISTNTTLELFFIYVIIEKITSMSSVTHHIFFLFFVRIHILVVIEVTYIKILKPVSLISPSFSLPLLLLLKEVTATKPV